MHNLKNQQMKQNVSFSTEFKIRHRIVNNETIRHRIVDDESYSWWLRSAYCENAAYINFFGYISLFDTYYSDRMFSHPYGVLLACVI